MSCYSHVVEVVLQIWNLWSSHARNVWVVGDSWWKLPPAAQLGCLLGSSAHCPARLLVLRELLGLVCRANTFLICTFLVRRRHILHGPIWDRIQFCGAGHLCKNSSSKSREGNASERGKPMTVSQPAWPSWKILTLLLYLLWNHLVIPCIGIAMCSFSDYGWNWLREMGTCSIGFMSLVKFRGKCLHKMSLVDVIHGAVLWNW